MTQLEDRQIINLFYERSEQAIEELDRKYGAAVSQYQPTSPSSERWAIPLKSVSLSSC